MADALANIRSEYVTTEEERDAARNIHGSGEVEVDEDAMASRGSSEGVWIQGWLFVYNDQIDYPEDKSL